MKKENLHDQKLKDEKRKMKQHALAVQMYEDAITQEKGKRKKKPDAMFDEYMVKAKTGLLLLDMVSG